MMFATPKRQRVLTKEQRQMYASEKQENFRWISKLAATYSPRTLTNTDLVSESLRQEIVELGQFAEVAYSAVPVEFLLKHFNELSKPEYPLEKYNALKDAILVHTFRGTFAELPVYIAFRPSTRQLVVAITGTASMKHVLQDLRVLRTPHPSGRGTVHTGFWNLYRGIKAQAVEGIEKGLSEHPVTELVLTGHSMGGSMAYLLCMDLLAGDEGRWPQRPDGTCVKLKIATFGSPRTGDADLVHHFRKSVISYQTSQGHDSFKEFAVKGYNDGVPALPPARFGYRHFAAEPLYTEGGKLYHTPASDCEHAMFHILDEQEAAVPIFPQGGHNYYNGRDLEGFCRRITWLDRAKAKEEGWEERYRQLVDKFRSAGV